LASDEKAWKNSIDKFVKRGNKAFVRLNTRSPKDAVDKIPNKLNPILKKELDSFDHLGNNEIHIALRRYQKVD
jgi:hypothetical protein